MKNKTVRIATTTDGSRYLVQQLDFNKNTAHCWGEISTGSLRIDRQTGALIRTSTKHSASKEFSLASVKIASVSSTPDLYRALYDQAVRNLAR